MNLNDYKDFLVDKIKEGEEENLKYMMTKTGYYFNDYNSGDFIAVGGRKTSGKSSFILNNYVSSLLHQKIKDKKNVHVKITYVNTRKTLKSTLDKMVVNYSSLSSNGTKLEVGSLYGYSKRYNPAKATRVKIVTGTVNFFNAMIQAGHLNIRTGYKTIAELEQLITETFDEYGEFDDNGIFHYYKDFEKFKTVVVIDDASGIMNDGIPALRNEAAKLLAIKLQQFSKIYSALIVLGVPSHVSYRARGTSHESNSDEIFPYSLYCDRSIILHNPSETEEKNYHGYEVDTFVNPDTGICYLRTGYISSNYMGASGNTIAYFMYPENGFMMELPPPEEEDDLNPYKSKVLSGKSKKAKDKKLNEDETELVEKTAKKLARQEMEEKDLN